MNSKTKKLLAEAMERTVENLLDNGLDSFNVVSMTTIFGKGKSKFGRKFELHMMITTDDGEFIPTKSRKIVNVGVLK